jgi:hypothetical protein
LFLISLPSIAQNRDRNNGRTGRDSDNREEFMAKRNTYLTEKMGLTAEETARFIPLENELLRKKLEFHRECFRYERELRNKQEKSDDDYKKLLKCREDAKEKTDKLDKEYFEKFKKIMSAEKFLKYQKADKDFSDSIRDRR